MNNYANSRWKERGSFSKDILHSYQDIIDAIRTAPYGFDTREAMAQMLMFLYSTVQSIGDSFSIDMSPTDTFENLGKLKEKYPNGQQGIFVIQDTGHWYFWSELENTWKDGGIYQSAGINFSNTPANKLGGYVVPLSTRSIGISYGSNQTITIDFSKTKNTIACHLSGHAHIDETHVDNGVLSIGVLCDAAYNDDPQYKDKPRTKGTINEQAFDVVSIDTFKRTVKLVRIGQGNDREFNY